MGDGITGGVEMELSVTYSFSIIFIIIYAYMELGRNGPSEAVEMELSVS